MCGGGGGYKTGVEGGGGTTSFEVVLTWELEVLAIVMGGGRKKCPPFKRGAYKKVLTCYEGGAKSFGPAIFPFCSPPPTLPVINAQSLGKVAPLCVTPKTMGDAILSCNSLTNRTAVG